MNETKAQQIEDIQKELSKLDENQLGAILINCADAHIKAESENGVISGKDGFKVGYAIIEYIERASKAFKK